VKTLNCHVLANSDTGINVYTKGGEVARVEFAVFLLSLTGYGGKGAHLTLWQRSNLLARVASSYF
jgi:hypothetical protein